MALVTQLTAVHAHIRVLELTNKDGEVSFTEQEGEYCHSAIPRILKGDISFRLDAYKAESLAPPGFFGAVTFYKGTWEQHLGAQLNVENNAVT